MGFIVMNGNPNQRNAGEQIKDALTDALQGGDFRRLNSLVTQTVTDTLNEVGRQIAQGAAAAEDIPLWKQRANERAQRNQEELHRDWQAQVQRSRQEQLKRQEALRRQDFARQQAAEQQPGSMAVPAVQKKNVGRVSGILYQIFGGIGLGITGFVTMGRLFLLLAGGFGADWAGWLVNISFLLAFGGMIGMGGDRLKRLKRADRYISLCGAKMYGEIEKLAQGMGRSRAYVTRDLQRMLASGIFPEGHLDGQKTCFMLTDTIYGQYLELEQNRQVLEAAEKAAGNDTPNGQASEHPQENELNAMVSEGMECIRRLRELNDHLEGEAISDKLFRLESLLKEIFDSIREHPEQMHRMHKLMEYYLPTTLKLVEAYEEFDKISVPGEEVVSAKAEIEKTLDIINQAFVELLNNLFRDAAFDAATDAQVLKSMLAREGLTKEMYNKEDIS